MLLILIEYITRVCSKFTYDYQGYLIIIILEMTISGTALSHA